MLNKKQQRLRRARQTRIRIATQGVARLTVNRTNLHIYASIISGCGTKVLASASTAEVDVRKSLGTTGKGGNAAAAAIDRVQQVNAREHLDAEIEQGQDDDAAQANGVQQQRDEKPSAAATAEAEPPDDPPGVSSALEVWDFHGFFTGPKALEWIRPGPITPEAYAGFVTPYAADQMEAVPVSSVVNNARNDIAECIVPLAQL